MKRRDFLKVAASMPVTGSVGTLAGVGSAQAATPWENGTEWKKFEITTRVDLAAQKGASRVWLPMPLSVDTDYFQTLGNSWTGNAQNMRVFHDAAQGTKMFYAEWSDTTAPATLELTSGFLMRDRAVDLSKPGKAQPLSAHDTKEYLKATAFIPTDGIVRKTALEITKGAKSDVDKAHAIHEWIVMNCARDGKVRGCGLGDIKVLLETGNLSGKCADLNALFVGLARSVGIPARDVFGARVAPSQGGYRSMSAADNVTRAQHCRAEFYAASHGWVPVDPADVRKVMLEEPPGNLSMTDPKVKLAREKLFGAWEMNWVACNYSHDVKLPGSAGAAVPFFMYPTAEINGQRKDSLDPDSFKYTITSRKA